MSRPEASIRTPPPDGTGLLREDSKTPFVLQLRERFLQILWNEQRLSRSLATVDGVPLEVLAPGTWNVSAGPDFRDGVIRIGGRQLNGDVEVHVRASDWDAHAHDGNPAYDNVVLHVVWEPAPVAIPTHIPCLCMSGSLDASLHCLMNEISAEVYPYAFRVPPGACAVRWAMTDDHAVAKLLDRAGVARFLRKAATLRRQAVSRGFDQILYEGVFEALGYRVNKETFRELAGSTPLEELRQHPCRTTREAVLFGRAGLLPDPSVAQVCPGLRGRLSELWDRWWQTGGKGSNLTWRRTGSRPSNSPERRLAAGVGFLDHTGMFPLQWLLDTVSQEDRPARLPRALENVFPAETVWDSYASFAKKLPRPARLVGRDRLRDMAANVFLPFLHAYGEHAASPSLKAYALDAYRTLPRLQGNRLLSEAVHRFLVPPSRGTEVLVRASRQQGLLELYRSFCLPLHTQCDDCPMAVSGE